MLEKVPYWLCHESFTNEVLQRACCGGLQQQTALPEISELSAKLALEFIHLRLAKASVVYNKLRTDAKPRRRQSRLVRVQKNKDMSCACCASRFECPLSKLELSKARGYNMLDVEVMRGSWKSREGQQVRRYVGKFAKEEASLLEDATRLLRACTGMVIFADMAGRRVAKYRNVFSWQQGRREEACARLLQVLKCIESNSWGRVETAANGWPVLIKTPWTSLCPAARKELLKANVPLFSFAVWPPTDQTAKHMTKAAGYAADASNPAADAPNAACVDRELAHMQAAVPKDSSTLAAETGSQVEPHQRPSTDQNNSAAAPKTSAVLQAGAEPGSQDHPLQDDAEHELSSVASDQEQTDAEVWAELFSGPTSRQAQSYIDLRQETERALGQLKDPGVYTYKDKGDSKLRRLRLKAECSPVACAGCTRVLRASLASHDQEQVIIVKARGHHGTLQAPQGGCLWTVAEAHVIQKYLNSTDSPSTIVECVQP